MSYFSLGMFFFSLLQLEEEQIFGFTELLAPPETFQKSGSWAAVGVVLLSVHQNHFCVSTTPKMYTSNALFCSFFRLAHKLYFCQASLRLLLVGYFYFLGVCGFISARRNWKLDSAGDWQVSLGVCDSPFHCLGPWMLGSALVGCQISSVSRWAMGIRSDSSCALGAYIYEEINKRMSWKNMLRVRSPDIVVTDFL